MLKKIGLLIAGILIVLAVVIARRPDHFAVSRSTLIAAPPAKVFLHVNDLQKWQLWSPWARLDPNAKTAFSNPTSGVNAWMSWDGNKNVGAGRMTVLESRPAEGVAYRVDFDRPFKGTTTATFTLAPQGQHTHLTWSSEGKMNFFAKAMSLVIDCDKMMGDQFEQGFANLKTLLEPTSK